MNWYYVEDGKQAGPISDGQFDEMFRSGKIKPDTLVWQEGMADWVPCRQVKGDTASTAMSAPTAGLKPEAVCTECGKIFPIDETISYGNARVCAACKPAFLQKLQEGASINTSDMRYAGFWIRFAAKFLDGLIIGVPFMIIFMLMGVMMVRSGQPPTGFDTLSLLIRALFFVLLISYEIFFLGKYGATPGKMVCKIHVVTGEGEKITYGRAAGRAFAERLSGLICYIGYIMVAFDNPEKRALHDRICNTRVVYK